MTDTDVAQAGQDTEAADAPGIRILAQFIRDLSFENPRAPESLRAVQGGQQPSIDMQVEMNARGRPDGLFEVDLRLTIKLQGKVEPYFEDTAGDEPA